MTAEQERSASFQTQGAMRTDRGGAMVDTKGIGQPFMLRGTAEQDFGEWTHKVRTFMFARFGDQILTALTWAARQRMIVVKGGGLSQRDGDEDEHIDNIDVFVGKFYACLVSFTTDAPNRIVRNSGEGNGLEAWRRLHGECDPTSSMRRVAILQQVQNHPQCQRVEDLGSALEDWLSKTRQYEMFTDRNGRPCQASLEETVMFTNEDEGFQELFDRLLACSSTKQSVKMSEIKRQYRRESDALSKGKGKGKEGSSGSGKGSKGQNNMSAGTVASLATTRRTVDRSGHRTRGGRETKETARAKKAMARARERKARATGKSRCKGKLNSVENWQEGWSETGAQGDERAEGWTWSGQQAEGWWKATDDQNGSSSGQWMSANDQTAWEPKGRVGGIEMNSIETKYIKQDRWGPEWLMLNYDSGAAVTALPIAVAGDLPLEKRGQFRVAPGAVIPNLGKIKMKSTDESGIERTLRGNITEVAKPLLSAAEVSKRWDFLLFEDRNLVGTEHSCCFGNSSSCGQAQSLESSWQEHQTLPRRQLVQWACSAGAGTGRALFKLDQDGS